MSELWLAIPGYEGEYEVSDLGRVRSLDRFVPKRDRWGNVGVMRVAGRVLALGPHTSGYRTVHLYRDGKRRATLLHIVVAETFHGPKPGDGYEVRHLDGDKDNCRKDNLAWGTRQENIADQERHGTRLRGEKNASAKLTTADVLAIRARAGEPQQALADEFGCTFSNISAIQLRKSWRHV